MVEVRERFNKKSPLGSLDLTEFDSGGLAWARELSRGDGFDIIAMDAKVIPSFDPERPMITGTIVSG
jgi:hypothetical protein